MRLGGSARYLTEAHSAEEIKEAVKWAQDHNLPFIVVGHGSNIVWKDEGFKGLIIVNLIKGLKKLSENSKSVTFHIGAGEEWDRVVAKITAQGLSGIECLSLIPGTVGATPVQNVGAYGQEIADTLELVEAYDAQRQRFVTLSNSDCEFAYRSSRFKTSSKGRFVITAIILKLSKSVPKPPFYQALQAYLDEHNIKHYDSPTIRDAVIAIRTAKMPDWHITANNGSFFANPIISKRIYEELGDKYPDLKAWEYKGNYKISAGWLLEKAGFKGYEDAETGMATWPMQALVLVNKNAKTTADLLKFKQKIVDKIKDMFGITLEQEPELLP